MWSKRLLGIAVLALAAWPGRLVLSADAEGAGDVILVRHAETSGEGSDRELSASGHSRAAVLAQLLADARIDAIVTSDTQRSDQTAAAVARSRGLRPTAISTADGIGDHVSQVVELIRGLPRTYTVLVVGHSNTLPLILKALDGPERADLGHCQHDALWILRRPSDRKADLIETRYGAPSERCD